MNAPVGGICNPTFQYSKDFLIRTTRPYNIKAGITIGYVERCFPATNVKLFTVEVNIRKDKLNNPPNNKMPK